MKNMYKTTNEIGNHRVGERAMPQPLQLQVTWIYEFCHWKVTKWRYSDLSHDTFEFFRYKHKRQRLVRKKIYVSRGMFHGIPLESDRLCSTCRNGQITEDVRKLRFDFPRGYQAFFRQIGRISKDILFK